MIYGSPVESASLRQGGDRRGAGARMVELTFRSGDYERGKLISFTSLAVLLLGFAAGPISARVRRPGV